MFCVVDSSSIAFVRSTVGLLIFIVLFYVPLGVSSYECKFAHEFFLTYFPRHSRGKDLDIFGGGTVKRSSLVCVPSWEAERFNSSR